MKNDFIEELYWRGMIHDIIPETDQHLNKASTSGYIGFDPTSDSLHIGSLVQIIILMHFQKHGHSPIALIGGATGMIGDPSGKSEERSLLNLETLGKNISGIKSQLMKFLNFDNSINNTAKVLNNYDWTKNYSLIDFSREIGKHISVNYMSLKNQLKSVLELFRIKGCLLLNSLINYCKVMISFICTNIINVLFKWEEVINGEILPLALN